MTDMLLPSFNPASAWPADWLAAPETGADGAGDFALLLALESAAAQSQPPERALVAPPAGVAGEAQTFAFGVPPSGGIDETQTFAFGVPPSGGIDETQTPPEGGTPNAFAPNAFAAQTPPEGGTPNVFAPNVFTAQTPPEGGTPNAGAVRSHEFVGDGLEKPLQTGRLLRSAEPPLIELHTGERPAQPADAPNQVPHDAPATSNELVEKPAEFEADRPLIIHQPQAVKLAEPVVAVVARVPDETSDETSAESMPDDFEPLSLVSTVGADTAIGPGSGLNSATGADTQVCPYTDTSAERSSNTPAPALEPLAAAPTPPAAFAALDLDRFSVASAEKVFGVPPSGGVENRLKAELQTPPPQLQTEPSIAPPPLEARLAAATPAAHPAATLVEAARPSQTARPLQAEQQFAPALTTPAAADEPGAPKPHLSDLSFDLAPKGLNVSHSEVQSVEAAGAASRLANSQRISGALHLTDLASPEQTPLERQFEIPARLTGIEAKTAEPARDKTDFKPVLPHAALTTHWPARPHVWPTSTDERLSITPPVLQIDRATPTNFAAPATAAPSAPKLATPLVVTTQASAAAPSPNTPAPVLEPLATAPTPLTASAALDLDRFSVASAEKVFGVPPSGGVENRLKAELQTPPPQLQTEPSVAPPPLEARLAAATPAAHPAATLVEAARPSQIARPLQAEPPRAPVLTAPAAADEPDAPEPRLAEVVSPAAQLEKIDQAAQINSVPSKTTAPTAPEPAMTTQVSEAHSPNTPAPALEPLAVAPKSRIEAAVFDSNVSPHPLEASLASAASVLAPPMPSPTTRRLQPERQLAPALITPALPDEPLATERHAPQLFDSSAAALATTQATQPQADWLPLVRSQQSPSVRFFRALLAEPERPETSVGLPTLGASDTKHSEALLGEILPARDHERAALAAPAPPDLAASARPDERAGQPATTRSSQPTLQTELPAMTKPTLSPTRQPGANEQVANELPAAQSSEFDTRLRGASAEKRVFVPIQTGLYEAPGQPLQRSELPAPPVAPSAPLTSEPPELLVPRIAPGADNARVTDQLRPQLERLSTDFAEINAAPALRRNWIETRAPREAPGETNFLAPEAAAPAAPGTQLAQVTISSAPGHVAKQLAEPLLAASEYVAPGASRSLRLKLRPQELGQVEIEITRDATGRLSAQLKVEHAQTSEILRGELPLLREALERAGLQVARLEVATEAGNTGSGWHPGGPQQQTDYTAYRAPGRAPDPDYFVLESMLNGGAQAAQDRLLNLHA